MKASELSELLELLGVITFFVFMAVVFAAIVGSWRASDCGSFDISAYKLGNVPARCAGYLVN